jgi:hypothetical protein
MNAQLTEDVTLTCRDCNCKFVLGAGEQQFFREKSLAMPKRCASCRAMRKAAARQQEHQW